MASNIWPQPPDDRPRRPRQPRSAEPSHGSDPRDADPRFRADLRRASDPRDAGPRLPVDPGGPRLPADPGGPRRASDPRDAGQRFPADPGASRRASDPRGAYPQDSDLMLGTGPSAAMNPRGTADPHAGGPQAGDPRLGTDPQPAADARQSGSPGWPGTESGRAASAQPEHSRRMPAETRPRGAGPGLDPARGDRGGGLAPPAGAAAVPADPGAHSGPQRRPGLAAEADHRRAPGHDRHLGENTRSVHLPPPPVPAQRPLGTPVYRTAAFVFKSGAEYAAILADTAPGYSYSRIDNPTVEAFSTAVASLEGIDLGEQVASQAFSSGMAAISAVFWTFTSAGSHVVAPTAVYGGTYGFLRNVASKFGVQTTFVNVTDLGQVHAAVGPGTAIVYAETVANPTVAVADLARLAAIAHDAGALFVVDSTLAPPVICRPLEYGADLVLHSATKYFGGHSDVTGGVVTGHPELIRQIRKVRIDTGGSLAPDEAFLLRRGLETLPLRVRRQCDTAQALAAGLARHPAVRTVYYPGLPEDPGHELARRQFDAGPEGTRFGAVVTIAPHGGSEAGLAFADGLRLAWIATSLGGTHTKVSHVASTTHRQMDSAALAAAGIDPGAVRFSIGLEDADDLLADAMAALDALNGR